MTEEEAYFEWLAEMVDVHGERRGVESSEQLLRKLHAMDFIWMIRDDSNISTNGMLLRDDFFEDVGHTCGDFIFQNCSVLEAVVSLARSASFIMDDVDNEMGVIRWFWVFMANAGLDKQDDRHYDEYEVEDTVRHILNREYDRNGAGGFFPVGSSVPDQRGVPIWYQLNQYLIDAFD